MPIVLEALPRKEFARWVRQKKREMADKKTDIQRLWTQRELMDHGKAVYATQCATCHQTDGMGLAPAFPSLAGSGITTGPVEAHIDIVLNGREGTAMQAWGGLLSESDIAAALTYTRNAFGNDTGDVVQPRTIAQIKKG